MSDDRTVRIGPDPEDTARERRRNALIGTTVAVVLAALVLVFFVARGGRDEDEQAAPLASETPSGHTSPTPAATDPAPASPSPAPSAAPTAPATSTERPATSGDVTAFLDAYESEHGDDVLSRFVDLDGDATEEIVAARVAQDTAAVDVAAWDGATYVIVFTDSGGAAERVDDLVLADFNGEGGMEIVTYQSVGAQGSSISVWGAGGDEVLVRQSATGGCWDGSHTYGITGATVEPNRIEATCDGSPLPPQAWPSDVYSWQGEGDRRGWTYVETVEPQ